MCVCMCVCARASSRRAPTPKHMRIPTASQQTGELASALPSASLHKPPAFPSNHFIPHHRLTNRIFISFSFFFLSFLLKCILFSSSTDLSPSTNTLRRLPSLHTVQSFSSYRGSCNWNSPGAGRPLSLPHFPPSTCFSLRTVPTQRPRSALLLSPYTARKLREPRSRAPPLHRAPGRLCFCEFSSAFLDRFGAHLCMHPAPLSDGYPQDPG